MSEQFVWFSIGIIAVITALIRFLPFAVFKNEGKTPEIVKKLGKLLPAAIMGMLVVYCLKDINFTSASSFFPQIISVVVVAVLYLIKKQTLLSIVGGTLCYMVLVQFVF